MNGKLCITCPLPKAVLEQQAALGKVRHLTVAAGQAAHIEALEKNNRELVAQQAGVAVAVFLIAAGGDHGKTDL